MRNEGRQPSHARFASRHKEWMSSAAPLGHGWKGRIEGKALWGGDVAKQVKDINQGGAYWVFRLPQKQAAN